MPFCNFPLILSLTKINHALWGAVERRGRKPTRFLIPTHWGLPYDLQLCLISCCMCQFQLWPCLDLLSTLESSLPLQEGADKDPACWAKTAPHPLSGGSQAPLVSPQKPLFWTTAPVLEFSLIKKRQWTFSIFRMLFQQFQGEKCNKMMHH